MTTRRSSRLKRLAHLNLQNCSTNWKTSTRYRICWSLRAISSSRFPRQRHPKSVRCLVVHLVLVKSIIEIAIKMDVPTHDKIEMCERNIKWCQESKQVFLAQRLSCRLAYLLYLVFFHHSAWSFPGQAISSFINSLRPSHPRAGQNRRQIPDYGSPHHRSTHLQRPQRHHARQGISPVSPFPSQSSLTACKMTASSIYVDAPTQADIDILSGVIYVNSRNRDYF